MPINCDFQLTPYRTVNGNRPVSYCSRPGCDRVGYNWPHLITSECRHPTVDVQIPIGDAIAGFLKSLWITEKTWPKIKHWLLVTAGLRDAASKPTGCGCGKRRVWLNRKFSKPLPGWAYKMLVAVGLRRPLPDRLESLLALGKIKK
jgi:hypothetical protein